MKNRSRKLLIFLLAVVLSVCSGLSVPGLAAKNTAVFGDFTYEILEDGTCSIKKYKGTATELIIPSQINGYAVTEIGYQSFLRCKNLTSITIPKGVIQICDFAFRECTGLTHVTIPDSVISIGYRSFWLCSSLTSIDIPNSVIQIRDAAFSECTGLTHVTIPDSVISLGWSVFSNCTNLTTITIPESVTSIGNDVFSHCSKLQYFTYDNAKYVGSKSNPASHLIDGINVPRVDIHPFTKHICDYAFYGCRNTNTIFIPEGVITIGSHAFYECESLTKITIPSTVKEIREAAFSSCSALTEITFSGSAPSMVSVSEYEYNLSFYNTTATVYYPANDPTWTEEVRQNYGGNLTWVPYQEEPIISLFGKLSSFVDIPEAYVRLELWTKETDTLAYLAIINNDSYRFQNIPNGSYVLKLSAEGGVSRSYPVEIGSEAITLDVKICPQGDIDGNNKVNIGDVARAYAHARGTGKLHDAYALSCGDMNGDGKVNIGDVGNIYRHIKRN